MRDINTLRQLQSLPLDLKIRLSLDRIRQWVNFYGVDSCYISFSGGKDSTVLLNLCRSLYPDLKAYFADTGLEFPEVRTFVKSVDNVLFLKPKKNFRDVILSYGYPFISKTVSRKVGQVQRNPSCSKGISYFDGSLVSSKFNMEHYRFLLDSPFKFSDSCCYYFKKSLFPKGGKPFLGILASESLTREVQWVRFGCNYFSDIHGSSSPLSFWTEQDILTYIKINNLAYAKCYGDIVVDYDSLDVPVGQLSFFDDLPLKCSGCSRTGCMFCGYGAHLESKENSRFLYLKEHYPKIYDYVFRDISKGGLGYKAVIDWLNDHGLNIYY